MAMTDEFTVTGPEHRRFIRQRVMRWLGFVCLIGGCLAILEGEALLTIAAAVLGLAWFIATRYA